MIVLDVYDENGEKYDTACCDGQNINDKVVLKKTDGMNREYTYKLKELRRQKSIMWMETAALELLMENRRNCTISLRKYMIV